MTDTLLRVEVCGGIWDVTPRGLWQQAYPSLLRRCAGSAARRTHTPDPGRRDHTTHAGHGVCHPPQPSSAAVSAVVVGAIRTDNRDHPHTASVLTWLKMEERQTFAGRSLYAPKRLCSKEFRLCQVADPLEISLEIRRKQTDLPRGGLRPSERPMINMVKRRAFHIWQNQSKT